MQTLLDKPNGFSKFSNSNILGIIVDHVDVGRNVFKKGHKWIFWFGDNTISEVI